MKDIKYIIKRVIIGVSIAFIIMFARSYVFADEIGTAQVTDPNGFNRVIGSGTSSVTYGGSWNLWQGLQGIVYSSFSYVVEGNNGSTYRPVLVVRYINAYSSSGEVSPCHWSSYAIENATNMGASVSYYCPVRLVDGGLQKITIGLYSSSAQDTNPISYTITHVDRFAMQVFTNATIDTSSITSAVTSSTSAINSQTQTIISQEQLTRSAINSNTQSVQQNTQAVNDFKNAVMSTDTTQAQTDGNGLFTDFIEDSDLHGLSGVVSAPFALLNGLTSGTCQPLEFTLPFVHNQVTLPCMSIIYSTYFGSFFTIYQLLISGILFYMIYINYVRVMKNLQNPYDDRIEVFSL